MVESEFDPRLNTEIIEKSKDSDYIIKEVEIEHLKMKFETPFKVLYGKELRKYVVDGIVEDVDNPIFEIGSYISNPRSFRKLFNILENYGINRVSELNKFFRIRDDLYNASLTTISAVFSRNPFVENKFKDGILPPLDIDSYGILLDYIHTASKSMVLVPDIRIETSGRKIIDLKDYVEIIDESVKMLSEFNKKPIFVPIQIQLSKKNMEKLLRHYKRKGYTNLWINFNASHIGGRYFSRVRTLIRMIDKIIGLNNVVLYYSHIKREIDPNISDDYVLASDILSQFFACDFIGINREPQIVFDIPEDKFKEYIAKKGYDSKEEYQQDLKLHKSRVFDPESYYYYKINVYPHKLQVDKNILLKKEINNLYNSFLLYKEVENTKKFVEEEKKVKPYLKNKKAVIEGNVLNEIIPTSEEVGILDNLLSKFRK